MFYWLVMPAAGAGRRFGGAVPKQHARLAGVTLLDAALRPFLADARCRGGVVVMPAVDAGRESLRQRLPASFELTEGGVQRAHSVRNGLAALATRASAQDWVLVHDAARPCLSGRDLDRLLRTLSGHPLGGLLATRVADTVKSAGIADAGTGTALCTGTLARDTLWLAQTPQMFRHEALLRALEQALAVDRLPTDEAQAFEWQGASPVLVAAEDANPKVTNVADLQLAASILATREAQG